MRSAVSTCSRAASPLRRSARSRQANPPPSTPANTTHAASRCHLQRALYRSMALNVGKIVLVEQLLGIEQGQVSRLGLKCLWQLEASHNIGQIGNREYVQIGNDRGLPRVGGRHIYPFYPTVSGANCYRQHAGYGANHPIQRHLANKYRSLQVLT